SAHQKIATRLTDGGSHFNPRIMPLGRRFTRARQAFASGSGRAPQTRANAMPAALGRLAYHSHVLNNFSEDALSRRSPRWKRRRQSGRNSIPAGGNLFAGRRHKLAAPSIARPP